MILLNMSLPNASIKVTHFIIGGFDTVKRPIAVGVVMLITYLLAVIANVLNILFIIFDKRLHKPMYILICNLAVVDILYCCSTTPTMIGVLLAGVNTISYVECFIQISAFQSHTFGSASHMILIIMAIDRYVAICHPLRYSSIMTTRTVVGLSAAAWGVSVVLVSILIGLTVRLSRCRSTIQNSYCDNASLFKLSCEDVSINNIYGLFFTVLLFTSSIASIAATYFRIALICWIKKNKDLNNKALQTCASHLVLYLIMLWSGFLTIILHRFPNYPDLRKIAYVLFHVVPANLNPIIYGILFSFLVEIKEGYPSLKHIDEGLYQELS
uniref:G-protein coupled receptors family 1 profile domain-containing protein n=1 Tax=Maylandia zebra TaxID=106582 RepID=A0A3P9BTW5_9CICH